MRTKTRFLLLFLFFISFFLLSSREGALWFRPYHADISSFIPSGLLMEDTWYGVYFQGSFIGYWHSLMRLQNEDEGGGYLLQNSGRIGLPVMGSVEPLDLDSSIILQANYVLNKAEFNIKSGGYVLSGRVLRRDDVYRFLVESSTGRIDKKIPFSSEMISSFPGPLAFNYIPLKKRIDFSFYDPFRDRKVKVLLENTGKRKVDIDGKIRLLSEVAVAGDGLEGKIYIDEKGKMIKQEFLGFTFLEEDFAALSRKKSFGPGTDFMDRFSLKSQNLPPGLGYVKFEISGIGRENLAEAFNQKVSDSEDRFLVEVNQKRNYGRDEDDKDKYLGEDDFIKFEDKEFQSLVRRIVDGETDQYLVLERLSAWIDKNINKIPTFSLPNTLDVLNARRGDCGELSVLLAGMLRAIGIPAYVNIGLAHHQGRFFYHAWVSAYINGSWLDTDPALGQIRADAARIKFFKSLSAQFELVGIIGKIKLKVVSYD